MRLRRDRHGRAFLALGDPDHELVVVDNAPATTTTESLIAARYGVALTAQDGCA